MKKQLQGIALILLSILLTLGFHILRWDYLGDFSLQWQHLFLLLGLAGVVMVFWPDKKDK